jgi:putative tRNA adenosine deaminase-associated protein
VSYFAAATVRGPRGWTAVELDLSGVADVEDVAERLRDAGTDATTSLLFVEADDAYLVIIRLDEGEDLRIFGSDAMFTVESRLGAVLLGEVEEPALDLADERVDDDRVDEEQAGTAESTTTPVVVVEPVGDPDLLGDLGVPAHRLLELCGHDGMLPSDITAEVCQTLGCGDEVEELRET